MNHLTFDKLFVRQLPGDPESANFRRQVTGACYSLVMPTPVSEPAQVAVSSDAAALLDLNEPDWQSNLFTQVCEP